MNSLIAMGALTSFAAGLAGPLVPGLALDGAALEEPVMLLAFVLLGRTLEARARLRASGARHALRETLQRGCLRRRRTLTELQLRAARVRCLRGGHVPQSQYPQDTTCI